jgi:hypothetical protein
MKQREFIHDYNDKFRPRFNQELFVRSDDEIVEAMKNIVYSCERDSTFTIKVLGFEVIDDYDDINHILWEYEDSIINKTNKTKKNEENATKKKSSSNSKKKDNQFAYINLKDSALKLIKVTYYIKITEKKNGEVSDTLVVYIAIPRIVDKFYFRLNGNTYSAMYQIVDASTYNNSASRNAKKQSITFKTIFMPIRVYRYSTTMKTFEGESVQCTYFVANMFKKSLLLIKYIIAKMGIYEAMSFLHIQGVYLMKELDKVDYEAQYIFPVRDMYVVVDRFLFNTNQIIQSFVYTLHTVTNYMRDTEYQDMFDRTVWIKALGAEFTSKDLNTIYDKGISILGSLEFIYDRVTMEDLKLPDKDKSDIYRVLRWMMYEFNALRQKDNLDITTKKVRWAEYIVSFYASRLAMGIYRISDKGDKADLSTIRKAIQIPPMYLINAVTKCQLVNYKDCVNDLDAITALKYTYKGISGIGEKSNAISSAYRSIHPSHLGRVDIDSSSNSDPGISGTICPLVTLHDGHFDEYEEPSTWEAEITKAFDAYRNMVGKKEMCRIVKDVLSKNIDNPHLNECIAVNKKLLSIPLYAHKNEEVIDGYDIFGDGLMWFTNEE